VSRNKLIMIASMMLTIVIVTGWLGENKPASGPKDEFEGIPSPSNPDGALAHYEIDHRMGIFTVFEDRIEALDSAKKTIIPFSSVINIREDRDTPGAVLIEYTSEKDTRMTYTFMMSREDEVIKTEGARDIDRLIALLDMQRD
jgi:hypothetical protein